MTLTSPVAHQHEAHIPPLGLAWSPINMDRSFTHQFDQTSIKLHEEVVAKLSMFLWIASLHQYRGKVHGTASTVVSSLASYHESIK
jgi:hypothetical protein